MSDLFMQAAVPWRAINAARGDGSTSKLQDCGLAHHQS